MEWTTRALMLAALLAATAAGAQKYVVVAQRIQFTSPDAVFGAVATASPQVAPEPPFLRVTLQVT